jgi:putative nucleotidyltransferase with HDIG domain
MNTIFRIFVCSTYSDLGEEREQVLDAIRQLQLQHDSMEFFGARTDQPIATCLDEVRQSDVLVVIVGHRYGNLVPDHDISFSEAEYREGLRLGKPCLIYLRDENVPVLPKYVERDAEKLRLLDKWKDALCKRHTIATFKNAQQLAVKVAADLGRTVNALEQLRLRNNNSKDSQDVLEAVARTEQLREAMTDLERSYDITLEALGDALDVRGVEVEGHSKRVTAYTIAIARAMGLPGKKIRVIARGAFLHDIGKLSLPDAILRKPGRLNAEETDLMRQHCLVGYQMVKKIPFLVEACEIIYAHQERYDGSGYPRALAGDQIPLGARIFAIADALDAITSNLVYRAARTISEARNEIIGLSGTQFDPDIVKVFAAMPESIWEDLRTEIGKQIEVPQKPPF